ncbi:MAG: helix-turn-helix domain-containing protein [Pseudomonadales bacterium]
MSIPALDKPRLVPSAFSTASETERLVSVCFRSRAARRLVLHGGDRLYWQGDPFEHLYVVTSGVFKLFRVSAEGDLDIVEFCMHGDAMGFDGLVERRHTLAAVAMETSSVLMFPYPLFDDVAAARSVPPQVVLELMARSLQRQLERAAWLRKASAPVRVAAFFVRVSEQLEVGGSPSRSFVLSMSRTEMAAYLGMTVESASRACRYLRMQRLVQVWRREIKIIDVAGLRELAARFTTRTLGMIC